MKSLHNCAKGGSSRVTGSAKRVSFSLEDIDSEYSDRKASSYSPSRGESGSSQPKSLLRKDPKFALDLKKVEAEANHK